MKEIDKRGDRYRLVVHGYHRLKKPLEDLIDRFPVIISHIDSEFCIDHIMTITIITKSLYPETSTNLVTTEESHS